MLNARNPYKNFDIRWRCGARIPPVAENYGKPVQNEGMRTTSSRCRARNTRSNLSAMAPAYTNLYPPPTPLNT